MSTIASTLLDFILDLFRDPAKAAAYEADPHGALEAAGLGGTTPEEVADLVPMVQDFSTYGGWNGGRDAEGGRDDDEDEGGRGRDCDADDRSGSSPSAADDDDHHHGDVEPSRRPDHDEHDHGHGHSPAPVGGTETVVITHLQEVHYAHTETTVEIDASHSIWVSGDAQAIFGDVEATSPRSTTRAASSPATTSRTSRSTTATTR